MLRVIRLIAVDESQPEAAEGSKDSGLQNMWKSQYQADASNFTDFFIAYATLPGYCDMHDIATTKFTQSFDNICTVFDIHFYFFKNLLLYFFTDSYIFCR